MMVSIINKLSSKLHIASCIGVKDCDNWNTALIIDDSLTINDKSYILKKGLNSKEIITTYFNVDDVQNAIAAMIEEFNAVMKD